MMSEEKELANFSPSTGRWLIGTFNGWMVLLLCLFLIGIPIVLLIWINQLFTTYKITNQRIILGSGIILRRIDEVELYRVKDVRVDFSLLNQLVNIGTITIVSSDQSTQSTPLTMNHVEDARKHRETLRNLVESIRQRRGVRELDVQGGHIDAADVTFTY